MRKIRAPSPPRFATTACSSRKEVEVAVPNLVLPSQIDLNIFYFALLLAVTLLLSQLYSFGKLLHFVFDFASAQVEFPSSISIRCSGE